MLQMDIVCHARLVVSQEEMAVLHWHLPPNLRGFSLFFPSKIKGGPNIPETTVQRNTAEQIMTYTHELQAEVTHHNSNRATSRKDKPSPAGETKDG